MGPLSFFFLLRPFSLVSLCIFYSILSCFVVDAAAAADAEDVFFFLFVVVVFFFY
jgi:hypothetical protein